MLPFLAEIQDDLRAVNDELRRVLAHHDPVLAETVAHLLAGGKRLRPALTLLAARFHRYDLDRLLRLAVALELLHMATLVHDDVVDRAQTRRGSPTVCATWGNRISVQVGNYLFARALILTAEYRDPAILRELAYVCQKMCEGEITQLTGQGVASVREYFYRIRCKTALFIGASCRLGAMAVGAPPEICRVLGRYGRFLGMAYQITDDILDLLGDDRQTGKPAGNDLRQGLVTLPVIYALRRSNDGNYLARLVAKNPRAEEEIREMVRLTVAAGGVAEAEAVARRYVAKAIRELEALPAVPPRNYLQQIAEFIQVRRY
ncbi:MAG: polyprenyl synthetase family protein [Bacillota bacterium]